VVVHSRLTRRVRKNPVAVALVLVAGKDSPADGVAGDEDVETTRFKSARRNLEVAEANANRMASKRGFSRMPLYPNLR